MDPDDPAWSSFVAEVVAWTEHQYMEITSTGTPLSPGQQELAHCANVQHPERIRVQYAPSIPLPPDPVLRRHCESIRFLGEDTIGLTLFYGICVQEGEEDNRLLLAHECQHVAQYEQYTSIEAFMRAYLPQIAWYGYQNAPLEAKARTAAEQCV